jgi:hypothetical protein
MKPAFRDPLPVEMLISNDARRVSVEQHEAFQKSISRPCDKWDEIDDQLDDMIHVDPYNGDPPSRRKDREISRVLGLLDSLERGSH